MKLHHGNHIIFPAFCNSSIKFIYVTCGNPDNSHTVCTRFVDFRKTGAFNVGPYDHFIDTTKDYFFTATIIQETPCNPEREIDKLIGDCVMAGFCDPEKAIDAAIEIKRRLIVLNKTRHQKGMPLIKCGFGLSYGPLVIGNIGSKTKMDFTLIDDTVNVASRLEALTKIYGVGICISEEILKKLDDRADQFKIRFLDFVKVKGKRMPIRVYEVFDYEPGFVKEKKYQILERTIDKNIVIHCDLAFRTLNVKR